MKAMTIIEQMRREEDMHFGRGTRDIVADALEELVCALLTWQAAMDWSPEEVHMHAGPAFARARERTDTALRRHGVTSSTSTVHRKLAEIQADAAVASEPQQFMSPVAMNRLQVSPEGML